MFSAGGWEWWSHPSVLLGIKICDFDLPMLYSCSLAVSTFYLYSFYAHQWVSPEVKSDSLSSSFVPKPRAAHWPRTVRIREQSRRTGSLSFHRELERNRSHDWMCPTDIPKRLPKLSSIHLPDGEGAAVVPVLELGLSRLEEAYLIGQLHNTWMKEPAVNPGCLFPGAIHLNAGLCYLHLKEVWGMSRGWLPARKKGEHACTQGTLKSPL